MTYIRAVTEGGMVCDIRDPEELLRSAVHIIKHITDPDAYQRDWNGTRTWVEQTEAYLDSYWGTGLDGTTPD